MKLGMETLVQFLAGLIFGTGLVISGMIDPAKVLNFLDVAGTWDPSLAFVMIGAVVVTAIGYRLVLQRRRPIFATVFQVPTRREIDIRLVVGAMIFGIGWGLSGLCPGPALTSLSLGALGILVFVPALFVGMAAARWFTVGLDGRASTKYQAATS